MGKGCAVDDCVSTFATDGIQQRRYRFPRDVVRCKLWVERCRNKALLTLDADTLYATKRVCGKHFAPHAFQNALQKRLVHDAVPSIFQFNMEESDLPKEPMVWNPKRREIKPDVKKSSDLVLPISLPQPRNVRLSNDIEANGLQENNLKLELHKPELTSPKHHLSERIVKHAMMPPNIFKGKVFKEIRSASLKPTTAASSNIQHLRVAEEPKANLSAPSGSQQREITNLMDLEPNIWEKHMEIFQQSDGKDFLIVGEVCMMAEKDPNQMCGSGKCNDDLYNEKRAEPLVRCWSRCKKWFHRRCTDLTVEEYRVLSNKESLRWLCEECCKDDILSL